MNSPKRENNRKGETINGQQKRKAISHPSNPISKKQKREEFQYELSASILCPDALIHIFSFFSDINEILQVRLVSKEWRECASHDEIWATIFQSHFGALPKKTKGGRFQQFLSTLSLIPLLVHIEEPRLPYGIQEACYKDEGDLPVDLNCSEEGVHFSIHAGKETVGVRVHRIAVLLSLISSMAYIPSLRDRVRVAKIIGSEKAGDKIEDMEVEEVEKIPLGYICYHLLYHDNFKVDGHCVGICPNVEETKGGEKEETRDFTSFVYPHLLVEACKGENIFHARALGFSPLDQVEIHHFGPYKHVIGLDDYDGQVAEPKNNHKSCYFGSKFFNANHNWWYEKKDITSGFCNKYNRLSLCKTYLGCSGW